MVQQDIGGMLQGMATLSQLPAWQQAVISSIAGDAKLEAEKTEKTAKSPRATSRIDHRGLFMSN